MEQSCFRDMARLNNVLKVSPRIACYLLFCILITSSRYKAGNVDDEKTQISKGFFKARQDFFGRPHVARCVFWKRGISLGQLSLYLSFGKVRAAVDVVGSLESVEAAVFQLLLPT
jgi:hypothetical protein